MKKLLSIFTAVALTLTVALPAFADTTNTQNGKGSTQKQLNTLKNTLTKTETLLKKTQNDKVKLEANIQKSIEKALDQNKKKTDSTTKQTTNANELIEKWQEELDKAAAHDKIELENLKKDIAKWTEMMTSQRTALEKQISTITTNTNKKIDELRAKLAAPTTTDAQKATIQKTIDSLNKYMTEKITAINKYLASLQTIWAERLKVWKQREEILISRQTADMEFRKEMTRIRIAELNEKLINAPQPTPNPQSTIEAQIRAKYQKQLDALNKKIELYTTQIKELQAKIKELEELLKNKK